ncbi:uncharacterized protein LOC123660139 [Melitaea cinxia]|uniref:uncharacterized protein LOC123660139 n=1 Tax=Melitaea cinxia TaxID=113334 RepID=UPI001E272785|nr:uncharacterized protein LOC123660139 [Melitaea cinxia]
MKTYISLCILYLSFTLSARAFFFFGENREPYLFCIKVCPLYCTPRRHDLDESSLIYVDEPPPFIPDDWYHHHEVPYHFDPYYFCKPPKPTTTTTTPAPTTTTTEEPSGICIFCMKKCTKYPKS